MTNEWIIYIGNITEPPQTCHPERQRRIHIGFLYHSLPLEMFSMANEGQGQDKNEEGIDNFINCIYNMIKWGV